MIRLGILNIVLLFIPFFSFSTEIEPPDINNPLHYSFIIAGHAYGSHQDTCECLHLEFTRKLLNSEYLNVDFIVFLGDLIRTFNSKRNWATVINQLKDFGRPYYIARGNHENGILGTNIMDSLYGNSFYYFVINTDKFIFLDTQIKTLSISTDQINFTREILPAKDTTKNVFIFLGEVLWNNHPKYREIKANGRSRWECGDRKTIKNSNFWSDLYPITFKTRYKLFYYLR